MINKRFNIRFVLTTTFVMLICLKATDSTEKIVYQSNCKGPTIVTEPGVYNIISLVSFKGDNISKNIARFHLKLRYIIASQIKLKGSYSKIGFIAFNVCDEKDKLVNALLDIFLSGEYNPRASSMKEGGSCNCQQMDPSTTLSVVSFLPDFLTTVAVTIMSTSGIPYFAYTEERTYESVPTFLISYFPNYNIIQNDAKEITNEILRYGVSHVMLLQLKTSNQRIAELYRNLIWKNLRHYSSICVTKINLDVNNVTEMDNVVSKIRNGTSIKMIIIWSNSESRQVFLKKTDLIFDRLWYWYTEIIDNDFAQHLVIDPFALKTHFFRLHPAFAFQHLNEDFSYGQMQQYIGSFAYSEITKDPWLKFFTARVKKKTPADEISKVIKSFDDTTNLEEENIEAVLLPIWWAKPYLHVTPYIFVVRNMINRAARNDILYVNFAYDKKTEKMRQKITWTTQLPKSVLHKLTTSIVKCSRTSCPIGFESLQVEFNVSSTEIKYGWKCLSCTQGHFKSNEGNHSCLKCPKHYHSTSDYTECYDPYTNIYTDASSVHLKIYFTLQTCCGLFSVLAIGVFLKFKQTPVIRSAHYTSSLVQLSCHLMLTASLPFLFLKLPPEPIQCTCQTLVSGILGCIVNSITLTKSQKLLSAFQAKLKLTRREIRLSKSVELFTMVLTVSIFIGILAITKLQQQFIVEVQMTMHHEDLTREFYCSNGDYMLILMLYLLLIAMGCLVQAFRARTLPKNFNETKTIMYCMFVSSVVLMVRFPVWYGQKQKSNRALVDLYILSLVNGIQLFFMYSTKTYVVIFKPEQNTARAFHEMALRNAEKKARKYFKTN